MDDDGIAEPRTERVVHTSSTGVAYYEEGSQHQKKQNERKSVRTCEAKKEASRKKGRKETHRWKGMARAGGTLPGASLAGRWSK